MKRNRDSGIKNQEIGRTGEEIASEFLEGKGHVVLARNYKKPWGELDLVTSYNNTIHVIEVKTMEVEDFSRERGHEPQELVNKRKLQTIARTAALYMEDNHDTREYQIDVVAVLLNTVTRTARCRYIEQVLEDNL